MGKSRNLDELLHKVEEHNVGGLLNEDTSKKMPDATMENMMEVLNQIKEILSNSHVISKDSQDVTVIIGEHRLSGKMNVYE